MLVRPPSCQRVRRTRMSARRRPTCNLQPAACNPHPPSLSAAWLGMVAGGRADGVGRGGVVWVRAGPLRYLPGLPVSPNHRAALSRVRFVAGVAPVVARTPGGRISLESFAGGFSAARFVVRGGGGAAKGSRATGVFRGAAAVGVALFGRDARIQCVPQFARLSVERPV